MARRKAKIAVKPAITTAPNETIVEYSFPDGKATGGLITFTMTDDGQFFVDLYRHDADVTIRVGKAVDLPRPAEG